MEQAGVSVIYCSQLKGLNRKREGVSWEVLYIARGVKAKRYEKMKRKNRATCISICPPTQLVNIPAMILAYSTQHSKLHCNETRKHCCWRYKVLNNLKISKWLLISIK